MSTSLGVDDGDGDAGSHARESLSEVRFQESECFFLVLGSRLLGELEEPLIMIERPHLESARRPGCERFPVGSALAVDENLDAFRNDVQVDAVVSVTVLCAELNVKDWSVLEGVLDGGGALVQVRHHVVLVAPEARGQGSRGLIQGIEEVGDRVVQAVDSVGRGLAGEQVFVPWFDTCTTIMVSHAEVVA